MTARQVSGESGVPYGRIYDVLNSLEHRGLIVKSGHRPLKFHAVSPDIAIDRLKSSKIEELDRLMSRADTYLRELKNMYHDESTDEMLWKLGLDHNSLPVYFSSILESKIRYCGYVDIESHKLPLMSDIIDETVRVFSDLARRGVRIQLLLGVAEKSNLVSLINFIPQSSDLVSIAEVRLSHKLQYPFSIIDDDKVLIKVKNPSNVHEDLGVLYIWQKDLALRLQKKFDDIWDEAEPLAQNFVHQ